MLATVYTFKDKGTGPVRRAVVGGDPIILKNQYDPDQHWLPFMAGAVFDPPPAQPEPTEAQRAHEGRTRAKQQETMRARLAKPFATIQDKYRTMHPYVPVYQHVLPFHGFWRMGNQAFSLQGQMGYPAFERTQSGKLAAITFKNAERGELLLWCKENATGPYNVAKTRATFACVIDAVAARILFSDGAAPDDR